VALIRNSPRLREAPQFIQRLLDWLKTSFTERSAFILYTRELHLSHTTLTNMHNLFIHKLIRVSWRNLYKMYSYYWLPWWAFLRWSLIVLTICFFSIWWPTFWILVRIIESLRRLSVMLHFDALGHDNRLGISFMLRSNASAINGKRLSRKSRNVVKTTTKWVTSEGMPTRRSTQS